jgi:DNA-binding CsgD family transcriptional regulator
VSDDFVYYKPFAMISGKTALLERINIAIRKKWFQNGSGVLGFQFIPGKNINTSGSDNATSVVNNYSQADIDKLEQRVESIEKVNEELIHFVDFLVESLPELIVSMLSGNCEEGRVSIETKVPAINGKEAIKVHSNYKKIFPYPTRREKDVLVLLEKGFCAKEIAKKLFISETTVITHKKNLKEKYCAKNTVELISKTALFLSDTAVSDLNA